MARPHRWMVGLLIVCIGAMVLGLWLMYTAVTQPNWGSPQSVAAPEASSRPMMTNSPLLPEALKPSPTPTPSPTEVIEQPPVFGGGRITMESIALDAEILEYSLDMMVPSFIPGIEGTPLAVNPPRSDAAYWFSANEALGASLWSKATKKNYIVGHNDPNPGANGVFDRLGESKPGDLFTITTATETFQLEVLNVIQADKARLSEHPEVEVNTEGRYLIISCDPTRGYVNGHSEGNVVVVTQVVVPEPELQMDPEFITRVVDRLTTPLN